MFAPAKKQRGVFFETYLKKPLYIIDYKRHIKGIRFPYGLL
jgi:hypothetical protein